MFTLAKESTKPKVAVFGIRGCGCNTINQLATAQLSEDINLFAVNTDRQSLEVSQCHDVIQIGEELTSGLGAGAKPEIGQAAAIESEEAIREAMMLADFVFLTAGLGGGTGTGAIAEFARIAIELTKPVLAVVTLPFSFEGPMRMKAADTGLAQILAAANGVICLPNDKLLDALGGRTKIVDAFSQSNQLLEDTLACMARVMSQSGMINIDIKDFISVIAHQGRAVMGVARLEEGGDLETAIELALNNPLIQDEPINNANGAIISVTAKSDIDLASYSTIGERMYQAMASDALVVSGLFIDDSFSYDIEVLVIATGIDSPNNASSVPPVPTIKEYVPCQDADKPIPPIVIKEALPICPLSNLSAKSKDESKDKPKDKAGKQPMPNKAIYGDNLIEIEKFAGIQRVDGGRTREQWNQAKKRTVPRVTAKRVSDWNYYETPTLIRNTLK